MLFIFFFFQAFSTLFTISLVAAGDVFSISYGKYASSFFSFLSLFIYLFIPFSFLLSFSDCTEPIILGHFFGYSSLNDRERK